MKTPRRSRSSRSHRPLAALVAFALTLAALVTASPGAASAANPPRQYGDLLIANHSFEDGLTGWTFSDGQGGTLRPQCGTVGRTGPAGAVDGPTALQLAGSAPCLNVGAVSTPVPVNAGWSYTAFADVSARSVTSIAIRWLDSAGTVLSRSELPRDQHRGTIRVTGTAPAGAVKAAVEIGALKEASVDRVLFTAQATVVGPQISNPATYLSSTTGVDENGRAVVYAVGSGSATSPAVLVQVDLTTRATTRVVQLPGATGSWTVRQAPDGTVYVGTYGSAGLWSYRPGAAEATKLGVPPIAGTDVLYGLTIDEHNTVYGGVHATSGAAIFRWTQAGGFSIVGPQPLVAGREYTRAGGYDPVTRSVVYGTGTEAHVMACNVEGAADCTDLLTLASADVRASLWAYGMTVSDGYAMAWVGDGSSHGNDWLVIYRLGRDSAGKLTATLLTEIKGAVFNGSSPVLDGKVYYVTVGAPDLHSYDLATGTDVKIAAGTPSLFARDWGLSQLGDPQWPGTTLVGMSSNGTVQQYNPTTGISQTWKATGLPVVSIGINTIVGGPDGRIWSSAYLVSGLGAYVPMRDDRHRTWAIGGQAEGMTSYGDRVWQGIYPGGTINSIDPYTETPAPQLRCTIEPHQSRPYGILGHHDRIYWGTMADYGATDGAFGYYDIAANRCVTIPGLGDQTVVTIAASGNRVYAGTMIYGGLNSVPKETQGTILRYDEKTGEAKRIPLPISARSVNASATSPDGTVWFLVEGWLLGLDPTTEQWVFQQQVFGDKVPGPDRVSAFFAQMITVNGRVYGNVTGRVFGFDPAALRAGTGTVSVLYEGAGDHITADQFGNLYTVFNSTSLLRLVL